MAGRTGDGDDRRGQRGAFRGQLDSLPAERLIAGGKRKPE